MTTVEYRDWKLFVDKEITRSTYAKSLGGPETCGCGDCENFIKNRELIYPVEIKALLSNLGIDYRKESEVWHIHEDEEGLHRYSGWFHFKGHFEGPNCAVYNDPNSFSFQLIPITANFSLGFHYNNALTFFTDKENLVQIEFMVTTPLQ